MCRKKISRVAVSSEFCIITKEKYPKVLVLFHFAFGESFAQSDKEKSLFYLWTPPLSLRYAEEAARSTIQHIFRDVENSEDVTFFIIFWSSYNVVIRVLIWLQEDGNCKLNFLIFYKWKKDSRKETRSVGCWDLKEKWLMLIISREMV